MRDTVTTLARAAGAVLREGLGRVQHIERKGTQIDLVTELDLASENVLLAGLREHFPDHRVVSEEAGDDGRESAHCWLIDPLDGTTNYAHSYPVFCVSMALLVDGVPTLGVVYDPIRDECFVAERGRGATLNDRSLHVSDTADLAAALLATGFPYDRRTNPDNNISETAYLLPLIAGLRRSGSAALDACYVAAGRLDGYWELRIKPWDVAAGGLMVQEAGGVVTGWQGEPWTPTHNRLAASNQYLHPHLIAALNAVTRA